MSVSSLKDRQVFFSASEAARTRIIKDVILEIKHADMGNAVSVISRLIDEGGYYGHGLETVRKQNELTFFLAQVSAALVVYPTDEQAP